MIFFKLLNKMSQLELNEGEIFKLGRVYIKVHKIKSEDNKYSNFRKWNDISYRKSNILFTKNKQNF